MNLSKVILSFSLLSLNALASYQIPGQQLMQYLASTCSTGGSYTQRALQDTRNLVQILISLRDDPNCQSISGAIASGGGHG